jgi:hypothetical protein
MQEKPALTGGLLFLWSHGEAAFERFAAAPYPVRR